MYKKTIIMVFDSKIHVKLIMAYSKEAVLQTDYRHQYDHAAFLVHW